MARWFVIFHSPDTTHPIDRDPPKTAVLRPEHHRGPCRQPRIRGSADQTCATTWEHSNQRSRTSAPLFFHHTCLHSLMRDKTRFHSGGVAWLVSREPL